MNKFVEMLNNNDKVILDVSVYNKEDLFALTGLIFSVFDYVQEDDYIKLYQQNGSELVLPINEIKYNEEDELWYCKMGDIEIFIFIKEIN